MCWKRVTRTDSLESYIQTLLQQGSFDKGFPPQDCPPPNLVWCLTDVLT